MQTAEANMAIKCMLELKQNLLTRRFICSDIHPQKWLFGVEIHVTTKFKFKMSNLLTVIMTEAVNLHIKGVN